MRTTIDLKPEHRARLLELAAQRGQKGLSAVIAKAIESHLARSAEPDEARRRALCVRGALSHKEGDALRHIVTGFRDL